MGRLKVPRGTPPEEFVRDFRCNKEDMEEVRRRPKFKYKKVKKEQKMLAKIRGKIMPCACEALSSEF